MRRRQGRVKNTSGKGGLGGKEGRKQAGKKKRRNERNILRYKGGHRWGYLSTKWEAGNPGIVLREGEPVGRKWLLGKRLPWESCGFFHHRPVALLPTCHSQCPCPHSDHTILPHHPPLWLQSTQQPLLFNPQCTAQSRASSLSTRLNPTPFQPSRSPWHNPTGLPLTVNLYSSPMGTLLQEPLLIGLDISPKPSPSMKLFSSP